MRHPTRIRQLLAAAAATLALLASSCASEAPPRAVPTTTSAPDPPSPTSTELEEPSPCDDPSAEDLGDGFFEHTGLIYKLVDGDCLLQPRGLADPVDDASAEEDIQPTVALEPDQEPPEEAAEPTPESEPEAVVEAPAEVLAVDGAEPDAAPLQPESVQPCPEGEHRHDDGGICHPDDPEPPAATTTAAPTAASTTTAAPTPTTEPPTTTAAPTPTTVPPTTTAPPVSVEVECAEGFVSMPEHGTETDDGCRPEVCEHGRGDDGHCLPTPVEEETVQQPSTNPDDHPCARQNDAADGLLGYCTADGVRYHFDGSELPFWHVSPGQGGERCPSVSGDYAWGGKTQHFEWRGALPVGRWQAEICVSDRFFPDTGRLLVRVAGAQGAPGRADRRPVWHGTWSRAPARKAPG